MSQVNTQHPKYEKKLNQWKRCRDVVAGSDAIKDAGVAYLPALKDQTTDDYNAYKTRASFINYTWKTINALQGMLFRKQPEIKVASSVDALLKDVTMDGRSIFIFAQQIAIEDLTSGRVGILVDYPQGNTEGLTLADTAKLNLRPILAQYKAENIINWKQERIDNEMKLTLVVLMEDAALEGNEYEHKTEIRYRVLDIKNKVYRQRVFRINEKGEDEQVGKDLIPVMNNKPLNYIPFIFIGIDDTTPEVDEPPLIDLVDVNLDHYRLSADLKHGLHFGGLPTAVVSGYTPEKECDKLYVGSSSAWVFPDPQAKASYLEYTGQGLKPIADEMAADEQRMAILGARLLSAEKKATETAQTAQIHRAGESSILSAIANTISIGLSQALVTFSEWAGVKGEASITLNTDFLPPEMTPQELTALLSGWQMGAPGLSDQGLFDILQKREVIMPDVTLEVEQERIASKPIPQPEPVVVVKDEPVA
jgi:hypothetical protein